MLNEIAPCKWRRYNEVITVTLNFSLFIVFQFKHKKSERARMKLFRAGIRPNEVEQEQCGFNDEGLLAGCRYRD